MSIENTPAADSVARLAVVVRLPELAAVVVLDFEVGAVAIDEETPAAERLGAIG